MMMVRCRYGANVGPVVRLVREQRKAGVKTRDERRNASVFKKELVNAVMHKSYKARKLFTDRYLISQE